MKTYRYPLEFFCQTDTGRVRTLNEDAVAIDAEFGIALVADGIGGHRAGDTASHMAANMIVENLRTQVKLHRAGSAQTTPLQFIEQIVGDTNQAIYKAASQQPNCAGMGTTLALTLFYEQHVVLVHVGDSRIYRLRNGQLAQLTRDDALLSDQVELGLIAAQDAGDSHNRHLLTQALGIGPSVPIHIKEEDVHCGDVYLLCSDGLNDIVEESDIELIVDSLKTNLSLATGHLVQLANDNGGYDNISAVLVRVRDTPTLTPAPKKKGWMARLFDWLAA